MRKIDAHHHLWDLKANYYPWLAKSSPMVISGYEELQKDYLVPDFLADIAGCGVVKSVHVQASHDPSDPVRETRWLQAQADDPRWGGFPHGIVGHVDLGAPDAAAILDAHCESRNMRGIRQSLIQHVVDPNHVDPRTNPEWEAGFKLLAQRNLSFDLQVFHTDMDYGARLAGRHPQVQFIVTHVGYPMQQGDSDYMRQWAKGLQLLSRQPNVAIKLSGFSMFDRRWTRESIKPLIRRTIEWFGPKRCMFASNFPVDRMSAPYPAYWRAYEAAVQDLSADEQADLFYETAARLYRL